jgi:DNA-binding beta-propeller fold protein YncE
LTGSTGEVWVLFQTGARAPKAYLPDPSQPGRVGRIDPRTNAFVGKDLKIGDSGGYDAFAASPTKAWVGDFSSSTVTAIGEAGSADDRRAGNR